MIERKIIDSILDAAKIEEVVQDCLGSYEAGNRSGLKKSGTRYEALCPFHADKSLGSFVVYPKGNCYKCFSCGAKGGVIDFLMDYEHLTYPDAIRWLGKKYNIPVDDVPVDWTYQPRPAPPPLPMMEIPKDQVLRCQNLEDDLLINWIKSGINWDYVQRSRIDKVLSEYHVGHGRYGHTIFWQIDEKGRVRTGKMMKYQSDGHRDKFSPWNFDWIHAALFRSSLTEYDEARMDAKPTFFGMHLLNAYKGAQVNIVESEKTALLMAIAYGNHARQVWMACGGLEMMSRERLQPIIDQRRKIVLFPDRDGIGKWRIKAEQMHYDGILINDEPVTRWWTESDGDKADIADVVVRMINSSRELTTMREVAQTIPQVAPMIEKLNLEIDNGRREEKT